MFATYQRLNLHVAESSRAVVQAASLKLRPEVRRAPAFREARHGFYRQMLQHHEAARAICRQWRM